MPQAERSWETSQEKFNTSSATDNSIQTSSKVEKEFQKNFSLTNFEFLCFLKTIPTFLARVCWHNKTCLLLEKGHIKEEPS